MVLEKIIPFPLDAMEIPPEDDFVDWFIRSFEEAPHNPNLYILRIKHKKILDAIDQIYVSRKKPVPNFFTIEDCNAIMRRIYQNIFKKLMPSINTFNNYE